MELVEDRAERRLAPVYDDRATMRQYDRCGCGKVKAKQAQYCRTCWNAVRRKREYMKELNRLPRTRGTAHA